MLISTMSQPKKDSKKKKNLKLPLQLVVDTHDSSMDVGIPSHDVMIPNAVFSAGGFLPPRTPQTPSYSQSAPVIVSENAENVPPQNRPVPRPRHQAVPVSTSTTSHSLPVNTVVTLPLQTVPEDTVSGVPASVTATVNMPTAPVSQVQPAPEDTVSGVPASVTATVNMPTAPVSQASSGAVSSIPPYSLAETSGSSTTSTSLPSADMQPATSRGDWQSFTSQGLPSFTVGSTRGGPPPGDPTGRVRLTPDKRKGTIFIRDLMNATIVTARLRLYVIEKSGWYKGKDKSFCRLAFGDNTGFCQALVYVKDFDKLLVAGKSVLLSNFIYKNERIFINQKSRVMS